MNAHDENCPCGACTRALLEAHQDYTNAWLRKNGAPELQTRFLTPEEQRVMHKALRRSVHIKQSGTK